MMGTVFAGIVKLGEDVNNPVKVSTILDNTVKARDHKIGNFKELEDAINKHPGQDCLPLVSKFLRNIAGQLDKTSLNKPKECEAILEELCKFTKSTERTLELY